MEQYISQLLEDMLAAQQPLDEENQVLDDDDLDDDEDDMEAHFAEVERYLSGEGREKIGDLIGFYPAQFPPVERLNESQMKRISAGFKALMQSHNVAFSLPENLPAALEYRLLSSSLDRDVYVPIDGSSGTDYIEFCSYDVESCPFGQEFCQCKDFEFDDINDFEPNDDEIPF